MKIKNFILSGVLCLLVVFFAPAAFANNARVTEAQLQNPTASTVEVKFNLSQDNPFGDLTDGNGAGFSDYIYVFIKYDTDAIAEETNGWYHATLTSTGSSSQFTVTSDGKGAFIKASLAQNNLKLVWKYAIDGVSSTAQARVKVMAIEMVKIPQGNFVYDVGSIGGTAYNNYNGTTQITVSAATQIPVGADSGWPNGYGAFYIMKYETSQGQYADFLNTISASAASSRWASSSTGYGYSITYTAGNAYESRYNASAPNRACNFLSWDDCTNYCVWAALRPMTEMEFEKAARGWGSQTSVYPWGDTNPDTGNTTYNPTNDSSMTVEKYYANYNNTGTASVTIVGNYLTGDFSRTNAQTGASPYGLADMAGSVWEHLINCAWPTLPINGNGIVGAVPTSWSTAASGKGIRGGSWYYTVANGSLRVSDRDFAGWSDTDRYYYVGFRAVRTL